MEGTEPASSSSLTKPSRTGITAIVLAGVVLYMGLALDRSADRVESTQQADAASQTLSEVAPALANLCNTDATVRVRVGDPACHSANTATAAQDGADGKDGANGQDGQPGADGVGITRTELRDGQLIVTYTDGRTQDVGTVLGPEGEAGSAGVGIVSSQIVDGSLVLTFSDGQSVDVGPVVGDPGRGIESTDVVEGRLMVTYTDGSTEDAGELPQGPQGPMGETPPPAAELIVNRSDGTTARCPRTGGDDSAPVYTCSSTSTGEGSAEQP